VPARELLMRSSMRRVSLSKTFSVLAFITASVIGCGHSSNEQLGSNRAAIVGGQLDTTHHSVVAVISVDDPTNPTKGESCTGTIVSVSGDTGYVLTAAHCFVDIPATYTTIVFTTDDYDPLNFASGHKILDHAVNPFYSPSSHLFDFAMLKFSGATGLPSTPVLSAADDDLAAGTNITMVGYGFTLDDVTSTDPDASVNTSRRSVSVPIEVLDENQIIINQTTAGGGQCQGDSGGPLLYSKNGTDYVSGVISAGATNCTGEGLSNRASTVLDSFIAPYVNGEPISTTPTCDTCQATAGSGPCESQETACGKSNDCSQYSVCIAKCADGDTACTGACGPAGADDYNALSACVDSACATYCNDAGADDAGASAPKPIDPAPSSSSGCNASGKSENDPPFGLASLAALIAMAAIFCRKWRGSSSLR
jgi:Trypsin